jgi:nucleoside-diphosphate-sugar epimerase
MRIFVAGATGAVGGRLLPMLVRSGHEVTGTTRSKHKVGQIEATGASAAVMDGLDADSVTCAVREARPDVIVHEMTGLASSADVRKFEETFAVTNALRTTGADNLLAAAREAGVRRFVAQSYAGWPYARTGSCIKTEEGELDPEPPAAMRTTLDAIRHLEDRVLHEPGIDGIVLRYGGFYGPGTSAGMGGALIEEVRRRRFPIVGAGTGVWSFVHTDDAASATLAAIERGRPGIYNIVDDEPAPVFEWLPALAEAVGAKPPMRIPVWIGRVAAGPHVVAMMTEIRGASNAKAKRELGWTPAHPSWREGFREAFAGGEQRAA